VSTVTRPRGPRGHFILGSLREVQRDQLGFYTACAREFGDVVPVRLGTRRAVIVYHPDAIEQVLVTQNRHFHKSPGVRLLKPLFGDGLLLSEGDFWLRQRRLVQPAFHRQRIGAYGEVMTAYTTRRLAQWKDGATIELNTEMMALTQAIVAKTLFDADVSDATSTVGDAIQVLMEDFNERIGSLLQLLPHWVPTPANVKARRAIRRLDAIVYRMIADRRRSGEDRGDLLSILLHAQDADDGARMTDTQVRDEVMTLFIAGHETTAVALSWIWLLLAQHPEVDARLAAELRTVLEGRPPTVADLPQLKYAEMVVTEAMRLYPPAYGLGRQAIRDMEIAGHPIPRRMIVIIPTWVVHRDARWYAEPETFRPERWAVGAARQLPRFAYLPFGGGPRLCIGNAFAMMEAVLLLTTIAQRFRLTLVPGQTVVPTPYVTLRPEPGMRMLLSPRSA
jgi:cytochrome P450